MPFSRNQVRSKGKFAKQNVIDKRLKFAAKMKFARTEKIDQKKLCIERRITELQELDENLRCCQCQKELSIEKITKEKLLDLNSILDVVCDDCTMKTQVATGKKYVTRNNSKHSDVNTKAVLEMTTTNAERSDFVVCKSERRRPKEAPKTAAQHQQGKRTRKARAIHDHNPIASTSAQTSTSTHGDNISSSSLVNPSMSISMFNQLSDVKMEHENRNIEDFNSYHTPIKIEIGESSGLRNCVEHEEVHIKTEYEDESISYDCSLTNKIKSEIVDVDVYNNDVSHKEEETDCDAKNFNEANGIPFSFVDVGAIKTESDLDTEEHPLVEYNKDVNSLDGIIKSEKSENDGNKQDSAPLIIGESTAYDKFFLDLKKNECNICSKHFTHKYHLSIHMLIHTGEKPHECKLCTKKFNKKENLIRHMEVHTKGKWWKICYLCSKRFNNEENLAKHILTHNREKLHECNICKKKFKRKENLTKHIWRHTAEIQYKCNECKQKFYEKSSFDVHMSIHAGEQPHECDVCRKLFNKEENLAKHMLIHTRENTFECNICNELFYKKETYCKHMLIHGEKPYACNSCDKKFNCKSQHDIHILIHTGEKPHQCDICNKRFHARKILNRHMLIHTGENQHECNLCNKKFNQKSHLSRHMLTHTGEKSFECNICNKKFSTKDHLKRHSLIHTGEKRFECNVCNWKFIYKHDLNRHMLIHTQEINT